MLERYHCCPDAGSAPRFIITVCVGLRRPMLFACVAAAPAYAHKAESAAAATLTVPAATAAMLPLLTAQCSCAPLGDITTAAGVVAVA